MDAPKGKSSAAELTRKYIDRHPSIRDCISKDLVNYSSLSRLIMKELGVKNEEAVLAASRRYAMKLAKTDSEGAIMDLLERSRLELKTKICIVAAKNEWIVLKNLEDVVKRLLADKSTMQVLQSANAITVISEDRHLSAIVKAIGQDHIISVKENLAEITVKSSPAIEETPGVFVYMMGMLSEQGINLLEAVSCYTDTIFIVSREDMMRAFDILSSCIEDKMVPENSS
ncbi:MAG: ACT domain-containing protein [Thermoplasmatota archaeon]|nr:ACT domain-containing protein [Candidatus Thermoplasmatota archaeon]MBU1914037.1 ACT domain-containing protein [Candidatus Thermoplasmatota archaeon]